MPIGLDIGHRSIKMIQLAVTGGHITVVAAKKVNFARDVVDDERKRRDFVVSAVNQILAEGKFKGRNVVACLPNECLRITSLRLEQAEANRVEQVLEKEAARRFGLDATEIAIRYLVAGDVLQGDQTQNELILLAAENESVKRHIQLLEDSGLRPVGMDVVPCALFRSFERLMQRQEDQQRSIVFIDIGSRYTTVVFGRGQEITFIKQIKIGGDNLDQQIASRLGITAAEAERLREKLKEERTSTSSAHNDYDADAKGQVPNPLTDLDPSTRQVIVDAISSVAERLANEISLCFKYYTVTFRGKRVERAVISGGQAYEQILLNVLRRQLAVDVEVAEPLRGFDMTNADFGSDRRSWLCEWAVAVGLSLKGRSDIIRSRRVEPMVAASCGDPNL